MTNTQLADALENLAYQIETAPVHLIGASVSVAAGPGGGSATGLRISVVSGSPGTHVVGMQVSVDAGAYQAKAAELVADLREAASSAKQAMPAKGWIKSLLERAKGLGNRALDTTVITAAAEIMKYLV